MKQKTNKFVVFSLLALCLVFVGAGNHASAQSLITGLPLPVSASTTFQGGTTGIRTILGSLQAQLQSLQVQVSMSGNGGLNTNLPVSTSTTFQGGTPTSTGIEMVLGSVQAQLQSLQAQVSANVSMSGNGGLNTNLPVSTSTTFQGGTLTHTLTVGSSGADVAQLQTFLNDHGYVVAQSGPGSPDNESGYFGAKTKAALASWQAANGLPATGYFGSLSMDLVNSPAQALAQGGGQQAGGQAPPICQSLATKPLQYSTTGVPYPLSGQLPILGYFAGDWYRALPGMPTPPVSFCGPQWQSNYRYALGNMIESPLGGVFQAVVNPRCIGNCQSGSTAPAGMTGTLYLPSPVAAYVSTCSDTGTTATCNTVDLFGRSAPVNIGEPYPGADIGSTFVIKNYSNPAYNGAWVVTGSTSQVPYTVSFTASGLGSGSCTGYAGTYNCLGYQRGTRVTDNTMIWQYLGPQNETQ